MSVRISTITYIIMTGRMVVMMVNREREGSDE
jgi:hypothetical protein